MKKRFWLLLALAGSVICMLLSLTGCDLFGNGDSVDNEKPNTETPAHTTHVWSTTYTEDGDRHYQTCSGCNEKKYSDHDFTNGDCVCGKQKPVEIHTHTMTKHDAVEPTCTTAGNVYYYSCSDCHKNFADKEGKIELTETVVSATGHTMTKHDAVEPTCTSAGNVLYYSCSNCHKNFVEKEGKTELTETAVSATGHAMTKHDAVEPTCTTAGNVLYYSCSNCHKNFVEKEGKIELKETVIPAGHNMTKHDAVEPTCTTAGNVLFYTCSDCHKNFADKEGNTELTETAIPVTEHTWDDNVCTVCHYDAGGSKCLSYELLTNSATDEQYYAVSKVTNRDYTEIVIPRTYNGISVTSIGDSAFSGCSLLTNIVISDSVTWIGFKAFYNCSVLANITYIGDMKSWCKIIGLDSLMNYVASDRKLYIDGQEITGELIIPDSVTGIGGGAFYGCSNLTSVTIPDSVTGIGGSAFYGCSLLTSITVDENNQNYASQDGILYNKEKTQFIHIPQALTGAVTIPDSVTSIGAFSGCSSLTSVVIGKGVTSIGVGAFRGCSSLTSVTVPDSVTSIGKYAFSQCRSLTSVVIPNGVVSIEEGTFYECSSLTSVVIGKGVTSIWGSAFRNCSSLTSVVIGNSVMSIERYAFLGCNSLTSVTIGNSVTSIGDSAFSGCSLLTDIIYQGTMEEWTAIEKGSWWDYNTGNYIVHCTNWSIEKGE